MADLTQVYAALKQADAAGDTESATRLAGYIRAQKASSAPQEVYDPTEGNSVGQNFAIGAGQAMHNLYQGAGQALGLVSRKDVQDTRELDAPLANAPGAGAGRFVGGAAALLPAAFIPGANTVAGASLIGAGTGLLSPSTSTKETALNTFGGGAGGALGIMAGRALGVGVNTIRSAVRPLYKGGQERIAAEALQSFAGGPQEAQAAASALQAPQSVLPGVQPTTAELANNAGLAQFERQLRNNPDYMTTLTQRNQSNRAAMTGALDKIAGTDADMTAAQSLRSKLSSPLYDAVNNVAVKADSKLKDLLGRPSMQSAWARARQLAQEKGDTLVSGKDIPEHIEASPILDSSGSAYGTTVPEQVQTYSGKALQYLKMSLNDMLSTGKQQGIGSHEEGALRSTLGSLNYWTANNVPELKAADAMYAKLSGPINQMEVGSALSNKLQPALADFGNNTRLTANSYANALRNGDKLAKTSTGFEGATLENTLRPDQLTTTRQIGEQLARRANADELGRAVGSNTSQNMISQNALRSILGPLGLPQSMTEKAAQSTLGQTLMRPGQWMFSAAEPRIMGRLASAALNPQEAASLLQKTTNPMLTRMIWERQGLAGLGGSALITAYLQQ